MGMMKAGPREWERRRKEQSLLGRTYSRHQVMEDYRTHDVMRLREERELQEREQQGFGHHHHEKRWLERNQERPREGLQGDAPRPQCKKGGSRLLDPRQTHRKRSLPEKKRSIKGAGSGPGRMKENRAHLWGGNNCSDVIIE